MVRRGRYSSTFWRDNDRNRRNLQDSQGAGSLGQWSPLCDPRQPLVRSKSNGSDLTNYDEYIWAGKRINVATKLYLTLSTLISLRRNELDEGTER